MSGKSSDSNQIISLPKGGGGISGIGEKFVPDLMKGTGNFTVPIELPPGRNGIQPGLELSYSSGRGNSHFGLGWTVNIPCISRKTSKGIPVYDNQTDTFIISSLEDLIPVTEYHESFTSYRPRVESVFSQIKHKRENGLDFWEIKNKNGATSYYGESLPGGLTGSELTDPAVIRDPKDWGNIFSWKITRSADPFGNTVEYLYVRDTEGAEAAQPWDQSYISCICYGSFTDAGKQDFLVNVRFKYEDRPDIFSDFRAGFEIRTRKRCCSIEVFTAADQTSPVRVYRLEYADSHAGQKGKLPLNGISLLSRIIAEGKDGAKTQAMPPIEIYYSGFEPEGRRYMPLDAEDGYMPERSFACGEYELVDLFGNGLPDIIQAGGTVRYWRNLGNGRFGYPMDMKNVPYNVKLEAAGIQIADMDGDGRSDLLVTDGARCGYYPLNFKGEWNEKGFIAHRQLPSFNLEDPETRLLDLDGDGIIDVLRTGTSLELYYNKRGEGFGECDLIQRRPFDEFPDVYFSDSRVRLADMNGDGLTDIVFVNNGSMVYWPYMGRGRWGKPVAMQNSPRFEDSMHYAGAGYDVKRVLLGDIDGDGISDVVYIGDGEITVWIGKAGYGWSEPVAAGGMPAVSNMDSVRLADILGNGTQGILWTYDTGSQLDSAYKFLDLTGGVKPYLLNRADNNLGVETRIAYSSSAAFYIEDEKDENSRWKTTLPFPVQVVSKVERIDRISKGRLTSCFKYHHGYWDGEEREFVGFGKVEQADGERFSEYNSPGLSGAGGFPNIEHAEYFSPPTLTRTWFCLGPLEDGDGTWREEDFTGEYWDGDPSLLLRPADTEELLHALPCKARRFAVRSLRGLKLRNEVYALDGSGLEDRPYTVTESSYGVSAVLEDGGMPKPVFQASGLQGYTPLTDSQHVFFPYLAGERVTQWDRGDDPLMKVTYTDGYDSFGQPCRNMSVALPRRSSSRRRITGAVVGEVDVNEERILAVLSLTSYACPDTGCHIFDRIAQTRTFELVNPPHVLESNPAHIGKVLVDEFEAAEGINSQLKDSLGSWKPGDGLPSGIRITGHVVNHYDGAAFEGRNIGELGPFGALVRIEKLLFTDCELDNAYGSRRPAYLGGSSPLPAGAPQGFGNSVGHNFRDNSSEGYHRGYYADEKRQRFDFQDPAAVDIRGFVTGMKDALGNSMEIKPDVYGLFPVAVVSPIGLMTTASYNYRAMKISELTEPNGNRTCFLYSPLGMLEKQYYSGRNGEGGNASEPDLEFICNLDVYCNTKNSPMQPVYIQTVQRIWHSSDNISGETLESREYSDGFGRVIQKRTKAEEMVLGVDGGFAGLPVSTKAPVGAASGYFKQGRMIVSGWQLYNNKGDLIENYEPFFSQGWDYQPENDAKKGKCIKSFYDAVGRLVKNINPNGSEKRVIFGIPQDLTCPDSFTPGPWETYLYDASDLAPLCFHPFEKEPDGTPKNLGGCASQKHHFTPASTVMDALGRTICTIDRNGGVPENDWYISRNRYDLTGNLLSITDTLGRTGFSKAYDLTGRLLRVEGIDSGLHTSVFDAAGNPIEYRDGKGSMILRLFDANNRIKAVMARDDSGAFLTVRQKYIYGDDTDHTEAGMKNSLGRLLMQYDDAGLLEIKGYDFKGNILGKSRRIIGDDFIEAWTPVDWSVPDCRKSLGAGAFDTGMQYDALNRPVKIVYPEDADGKRSELEIKYNRSSLLKEVRFGGKPFIKEAVYNAKEQRILVAYGNGLMTRYAYYPETYLLKRMRSEKYTAGLNMPGNWNIGSVPGDVMQDCLYTFDLSGNLTSVEEFSEGCGVAGSVFGRDRIVKNYEYDALYRLERGEGRSCINTVSPRPFDDIPGCGSYLGGNATANRHNAPDLTELYKEACQYDPMGNMIKLIYRSANASWTRTNGFGGMAPADWDKAPNDRMTMVLQGRDKLLFKYDGNGNLSSQNSERRYVWDYQDRMTGYVNKPANSSLSSVETRYLYAADGSRVKKWTRRNGSTDCESSIYIDDIFESHSKNENGIFKKSDYLHIMDESSRVAVIRRGMQFDDDVGPKVQYILGDHLDSSTVVADDGGSWINREEYSPFGETVFGGFARKRYRYSGKERDEESGLYYFGARYYAPWLCRWTSCDPAGTADGLNLYAYCRNNPLKFTDPKGAETGNASKDPKTRNEAIKKQLGDRLAVEQGKYPQFKELTPEELEEVKLQELLKPLEKRVLGGKLKVWESTELKEAKKNLKAADNLVKASVVLGQATTEATLELIKLEVGGRIASFLLGKFIEVAAAGLADAAAANLARKFSAEPVYKGLFSKWTEDCGFHAVADVTGLTPAQVAKANPGIPRGGVTNAEMQELLEGVGIPSQRVLTASRDKVFAAMEAYPEGSMFVIGYKWGKVEHAISAKIINGKVVIKDTSGLLNRLWPMLPSDAAITVFHAGAIAF